MARCPDCSKMVSLDNGDVEDVNLEVSGWAVDYSFRGVRNCADCGNTLKELSMDGTFELPSVETFVGWSELTPENQALVKKAIEDGSATVEVEEGGSDVEESGGGRYKKNLITTALHIDVTVGVQPEDEEAKPIKLTLSTDISEEHAAGEYEECC